MPNIANGKVDLNGGDQSDSDYEVEGDDAFNELFGTGATKTNPSSSSGSGPGRSLIQEGDDYLQVPHEEIEGILKAHGVDVNTSSEKGSTSPPAAPTHQAPPPVGAEEGSRTVTAQGEGEDKNKGKGEAGDDQNLGEEEGEDKHLHNVSADNDQAFMTPPSSIPSGGEEGDADNFNDKEEEGSNKIKKTFCKQVPLDISETWDVSLRSFNPEYKNTCMWLEGTFYQKFKQDCLHEMHHMQCPGPCTDKERYLACRLCHTIFCTLGCFKKITKAQHGIKSKENSEGDEKDMVPSPSKPETEPEFPPRPKGKNNFKKGSPNGKQTHNWGEEGNTNNGGGNKPWYKDNRRNNERQGGGRFQNQNNHNQRQNQPRGEGQGGDNQYQQNRRQQPYHNRGPAMPANFARNASPSSAPFDHPPPVPNRRSEEGIFGAPPGVVPDQQQGYQQNHLQQPAGHVPTNAGPQHSNYPSQLQGDQIMNMITRNKFPQHQKIPFQNKDSQNQNIGGNNRNSSNQSNYPNVPMNKNGPHNHTDRARTHGDEGKVCRIPPPPPEHSNQQNYPLVEGSNHITPQNSAAGSVPEQNRPSPINSDDENFHLRYGADPDQNFVQNPDRNNPINSGFNAKFHNQGSGQHQHYGKSAGFDRQQGGNRNYQSNPNQGNFRKDKKYNKNAFPTDDHRNRDHPSAIGKYPEDRKMKYDDNTSVSFTASTDMEAPRAFHQKKNAWKDRHDSRSDASPVKDTATVSICPSVAKMTLSTAPSVSLAQAPPSRTVRTEEKTQKLRLIESEPDIPFGVPIQVKHVSGDSFYNFTVMNLGDEAATKKVQSVLQNCPKHTVMGIPEPGDYCIVNYSSEGGEWNRAVVTKNLGKIGVFMVDLGIEIMVDLKEIFKLPAELFDYRPLAIRVKCLNIKADIKDQDVMEYFASLVEDKVVKIKITHKVPVGPPMYAGSLDVLHINKWFDVGILLQKFQVAESVSESGINSQLGLQKLTVAKSICSDYLSCSPNGTVQATIVHAVSLNEFYVSTKESLKRRFKIEQNLNNEEVLSKLKKIETMKDLACPLFLIFDETCERQVRVKVLEVEGPTSVIVQKVDYGDAITVPISHLKQLPRHFHEPACVFKCSLPLKPAPKLRNKPATPVQSFDSYIKYLVDLYERPATLIVYSVENQNTHIVELILDLEQSLTGCATFFIKTGGAVLSHDVDLNCLKKGDK